MVERWYKKGLVFGIIILFIGIGSQSAFAGDDKISTESFTIDNENENPITMSRGVYENTNCFVIGSVGDAHNWVDVDGTIGFGFRNIDRYEDRPSGGWIYTNGDNGKWLYHSILKGKFYGDISTYTYKHWYTEDRIIVYIGIEGFEGLALGAKYSGQEPGKGGCWFIGRADHVKIRTA